MNNNNFKKIYTSFVDKVDNFLDKKANNLMIKYDIKNKTNKIIKDSKEDIKVIKKFTKDEVDLLKKYFK